MTPSVRAGTGLSLTHTGRGIQVLAAAVGVFVLLEVIAAAVLCVVLGWSWQEALDAFVVTNAAIGLSFGSCGAVLAWHRPRNPIGWLFAAGGVAQTTSALAVPLGAVLHEAAAPITVQRLLITIFSWSWPWAIGLVLPLALLLFPDGRPISRGWRWVVVAVIITAPLFPLEMGTFPGPVEPGYPTGYLTIPFYDVLQPLWTATEIRTSLAMFLGLAALIVRYRRGSEVERRQLLWLVLAVLVALIVLLPWGLVAGTPVEVLFAIPLIPIAVTVAIVRVQLLDIRLVVSRLLAWLILLLAVLVAYTGLVALLNRFATPRLAWSAVITVLLVLLATPLLPRLQRLVDAAIYGDRGDPARVVSRLGEQLATPDAGLQGVISTIRSALRLPYLAIERDGTVLANDGDPPERLHPWPLTRGGKPEGQLTIGLRPGERELAAADRRALAMIADPVAVAVHSMIVSEELQTSRERIVAAREEERRRLRRELHDGLGPTLTGIAFAADAAANTIDADPEQSQQLLTTLRRDTRAALADIRRLVDNLRPPALDELGLVGALQQRADQLSWRSDGESVHVTLHVPEQLPALPAAIEVATYRIATEALTNVVRHSKASGALVQLSCSERLELSITDDGPPNGAWAPGVGLDAMRERAAELGGSFRAGPTPTGGQVVASFPLTTP
jgi:two-component system NarL family sensor kinase